MTNEERVQMIIDYLASTPYITVNDEYGLKSTIEVAVNAIDWDVSLNESDVEFIDRIKTGIAYLRCLLWRL